MQATKHKAKKNKKSKMERTQNKKKKLFPLMIVCRSKDLQTKTFKVPELTTLRLDLSVLNNKGENDNQLLTRPTQQEHVDIKGILT